MDTNEDGPGPAMPELTVEPMNAATATMTAEAHTMPSPEGSSTPTSTSSTSSSGITSDAVALRHIRRHGNANSGTARPTRRTAAAATTTRNAARNSTSAITTSRATAVLRATLQVEVHPRRSVTSEALRAKLDGLIRQGGRAAVLTRGDFFLPAGNAAVVTPGYMHRSTPRPTRPSPLRQEQSAVVADRAAVRAGGDRDREVDGVAQRMQGVTITRQQ
ncbi:hypothetical protein PTSG_10253 [Salpingoeca rosetta]|uniref:Uncharacterized protein n=1 Tax=Salpingoeca rosetta (strain ATCC 50818 / BSB-021) TaxID=946362 RepID=F2UQR6_SALR5|nr:uncharacterized protein PTSG_10253 [Salpingoeca rosetta]EGD79971.1 hypothetical protein PTSG_10253 [Salpingoeca rosetta]|eukprot:XP_004988592.1 hypothetical protein PTSG_10253 [Salpingoeca rosetta]